MTKGGLLSNRHTELCLQHTWHDTTTVGATKGHPTIAGCFLLWWTIDGWVTLMGNWIQFSLNSAFVIAATPWWMRQRHPIHNINWFKLTGSFTLSPQKRICAEWYNHPPSAVTIFSVFGAINPKVSGCKWKDCLQRGLQRTIIYQIYTVDPCNHNGVSNPIK